MGYTRRGFATIMRLQTFYSSTCLHSLAPEWMLEEGRPILKCLLYRECRLLGLQLSTNSALERRGKKPFDAWLLYGKAAEVDG